MNRLLRIGQAVLDYIIFSNSLIACCALAMGAATAHVFGLQLPSSFWGLLFFGALCSYSLHSYLTVSTDTTRRRIGWINEHKKVLLGLFAGAAVVTLVMLVALSRYWLLWLPAAIVTFLYTAPKINRYPFIYLRRIAVLKTAYLASAWTYVTVLLPLLMAASAWPERMSWWVLNRFFWIYCVCFWFDYRDRDEDRLSPHLTLVADMSEQQAMLFFGGLVGGFILTLFRLHHHGMTNAQVSLATLPLILLVVVTGRLRTTTSDYWYYGYVDSLLLLSGGIWLV
ncbi:hypothetical protein ACFSUS_02480 [Spirosoma soli]|uniref:UbiA family prenyltransferase n=1 Tax=Spirosoma soli TaxID=1770529 RepID=A0ABW5LYY9_9BACT